MAVTNTDLVKWLGQDTADAALMAQAAQAVTMASAMTDAYCRGAYLKASGETRPGVDAVILMASARMLANPEQLKYGTGVVSFGEGFNSWTLAERAVLDRYRKRAA